MNKDKDNNVPITPSFNDYSGLGIANSFIDRKSVV